MKNNSILRRVDKRSHKMLTQPSLGHPTRRISEYFCSFRYKKEIKRCLEKISCKKYYNPFLQRQCKQISPVWTVVSLNFLEWLTVRCRKIRSSWRVRILRNEILQPLSEIWKYTRPRANPRLQFSRKKVLDQNRWTSRYQWRRTLSLTNESKLI